MLLLLLCLPRKISAARAPLMSRRTARQRHGALIRAMPSFVDAWHAARGSRRRVILMSDTRWLQPRVCTLMLIVTLLNFLILCHMFRCHISIACFSLCSAFSLFVMPPLLDITHAFFFSRFADFVATLAITRAPCCRCSMADTFP